MCRPLSGARTEKFNRSEKSERLIDQITNIQIAADLSLNVHTYRAKYLLGTDLELLENVELLVADNRVLAVHELSSDLSQRNIIMPAFYNAHTHAGDIGLRGVQQQSLDELVGENSIKSHYLQNLSAADLVHNLQQAQQEHLQFGTLGYTDFREGGLAGVQAYAHLDSAVVHPLVLGRPESLQTATEMLNFGGFGIRDVQQYPITTILELAQMNQQYILQIHAGEDFSLTQQWETDYGMNDVLWSAKHLHPAAIVHTNAASLEDYKYLSQHKIGVILCIRSNLFTNTHLHNYDDVLTSGVLAAIGTDNGMFFAFNMWEEMRAVATHTPFSAQQILKMATINGSQMIGHSHEIVPGNELRVLEIPNYTGNPRQIYDDLLYGQEHRLLRTVR